MATSADVIFGQSFQPRRRAATLCRASTDLVAQISATCVGIQRARHSSPSRLLQRLAAGSSDAPFPVGGDQDRLRSKPRARGGEPDRLSRAWLATIVDCSDDAIVSKTLDGIITSWNRAAERLFGWTAGEAIGQHITLIVPKDLREEEAEVLAALRRGERVEHFETVRLTKDGRRVDMSITVSPIQDASGPIVGASTVARDISEKRRLDDQRALMLEREHEARQQAEALNRAKDEWLATVSHELRTPLNAIFGWARLLKDGALDEAGRTRAIETILRSASAQSRLVDELLDLARIGAGRMRFDLEPVDLNAIIEAALETVRPAAQAKNIDLIASLDGSIGSILGAPDRLQQVVWNLAMNSIKFTPSGGRVSISSRREAALVRIVVADTGQGIDGRVLPHVFEPFRQADSSITRIHGDLGLGLSLVRRLVEAHGGMVVAHSDGVDRGSTFAVTLPLPLADRELDARDEIRGLIDRDPGMAHLQSIRALVVDGDADFLEQLASSLRRAGANVRAVASAAAAHALARSWSPQVVVIGPRGRTDAAQDPDAPGTDRRNNGVQDVRRPTPRCSRGLRSLSGEAG